MSWRQMVRRVARWTLLDELLGFAYWAGAIIGIIILAMRIQGAVTLGVVLCLYLPSVVLLYYLAVKRLQQWFGESSETG